MDKNKLKVKINVNNRKEFTLSEKISKNSTSKEKENKKKIVLWIIFILIVTYLSFSKTIENGFTNWDDPGYLTENYSVWGLEKHNIQSIFSNFYMSNYHPFTMLSLAYDFSHAKLNPKRYHVVNLIFHIVNTLLVFIFIYKLTNRKTFPAIVTSLIFGIHPMHVESVAWISARKDVLFSFFYLIGLIIYLFYSQSLKTLPRLFMYILMLLSCFSSLMSKSAAVTFPIVLLLIDFFVFDKKITFKIVTEKIPFFILSIVFGIINIKAQSEQSISEWGVMGIHHRFLFANYGFWIYIFKFFVPIKLSAFHPYPVKFPINEMLPMIFYILPLFSIILIFLLYKNLHKDKLFVFCTLFYFINVVLILQFISVGSALYAERYSYLPYIGIALFVSSKINVFLEKHDKLVYKQFVLFFVGIFIAILSIITYNRVQVWKNSEALWSDVIEKYPLQVETAYKNRGNYYAREAKQYDLALKDYNTYISIKPNDATIYSNRGNLYGLMKKYDKSIADYTHAIKLDSNYVDAYLNRSVTYMNMNRFEEALVDIEKAEKLAPNKTATMRNKAICLLNLKRYNESINLFSTLISKEPQEKQNYFYRGIAYFNISQFKEALNDFSKYISFDNTNPTAYYNRHLCYKQLGFEKEALDDLNIAKKLGYK